MNIKSLIIWFVVGLLAFSTVTAQKKHKKFSDKRSYSFKVNFDEDSQPFLELGYGLTEYKHKSFSSDFAKVGNMDVKIGYRVLDYWESDNITNLQDQFITFGANSVDLRDKEAAGLKSELYSFGIGMRDGYGYRFGIVDIIPYTGFSISWNRLNMKDFPDTTANAAKFADAKILNRYNEEIRFGQKIEGGLIIGVNQFVSLNASYEANILFPRVMTWKHLGSSCIELIGLGIVDKFVDEIIDSSPIAAPIVNFILKNGLTYGFYMLQRDKMNYPFASERPLSYETYKIGLTFAF
ncbi:MAG: hypothetical protein V1773_01280 [bacterium]